MGTIQYGFGTGDAVVHTWNSPADVTIAGAVADAVGLDFDGDGRYDDALWDHDGDGIADVAALDLDDDGAFDTWFADRGGTGVWAEQIADPRGASPVHRSAEVVVPGNDGPGVVLVDTDGDGYLDEWFSP